jgi:hypothetical protein
MVRMPALPSSADRQPPGASSSQLVGCDRLRGSFRIFGHFPPSEVHRCPEARRHWCSRIFRGREPSRRAGYRGRRYCWPIARILRSVRWGKELGFTIKRFSAAWSGRWAVGRWRRSRIGLRPGQRTGHPAGGQSLVGVAGVRQGQGHGYLLRGATGSARGDIVREIIEIVRQVASGLPSEQPNPLDYGFPGG